MNIQIPDTGCAILESDGIVLNYISSPIYSPDYLVEKYVIHENQLIKSKEYISSDFPIGGTCLATGDLEWHPEYTVAAELISIFVVAFIFWFIYHITLRRFIK